MTQTANGQKNAPSKNSSQKPLRPGQRQQERLMRLQRRRRRQRIWTSIIVAVVLIAAAALGYWQYQRITQSSTTTTKKTATHLGPTCSVAASTPAIYNTNPTAGPKNPPPAVGTPAKNADGLQCLELKVGTGAVATPGSTVSVEYTGWLQKDGKKFDSSYDRSGQSFAVSPLGSAQVIQGWNEGLVGMKVGGTRRLIIPPALGYGAQGNPPIPGNATLVFDVTVLSVQ